MTKYKNYEKGNKTPKLLLVIMVIIIIILGYILLKTDLKTNEKDIIKSEGEISQNANEIKKNLENNIFNDGLKNPGFVKKYELDDTGSGVLSIEIFYNDINNDEIKDRITKTRIENGTDHFYYEYKIDLKIDDDFKNIGDFGTVESADCSLQKIKFFFAPDFRVEKISRDWKESWNTPTAPKKTVYKIINNEFKIIDSEILENTCDVSILF